MPTPLDRALQSKTAFWGFAGIIGVVSAWAIYGGDMFPQQVQAPPSASSTSRQQATSEPTGDPQKWTEEQLSAWLSTHGTQPSGTETREELLAMVESIMHTPHPS